MKIFPAIDVNGGRAVRLEQGDYSKVEVFSNSPVEVAKSFADIGAKHLHIVDLDGAKDGKLANFDTISAIVKATNMFVQVGGGIRDEERIEKYLDAGVSRVILGTIAIEKPEFVKGMVVKYGEKIAVGIDAKAGRVAIKGWTEVAQVDSIEFCKQMESYGVSTIIYTDIAKDGMMSGTNMEVYELLGRTVSCDIVASGGVTTIDEVVQLSSMNMYGAIIGRAIYTGDIKLEEAITYE